MNATQLNISQEHVHKLLCTSDPDATLLYLYLQSGNAPETAAASLQLSPARLNCATALLRQLDLIPRNRPRMIVAGQRPNYSEADVQTVTRSCGGRRHAVGLRRGRGRGLLAKAIAAVRVSDFRN